MGDYMLFPVVFILKLTFSFTLRYAQQFEINT